LLGSFSVAVIGAVPTAVVAFAALWYDRVIPSAAAQDRRAREGPAERGFWSLYCRDAVPAATASAASRW
jgi:hypothetical protein